MKKEGNIKDENTGNTAQPDDENAAVAQIEAGINRLRKNLEGIQAQLEKLKTKLQSPDDTSDDDHSDSIVVFSA